MPKVVKRRKRGAKQKEAEPIPSRVCTRTYLNKVKTQRIQRQRLYREQSFKAEGLRVPVEDSSEAEEKKCGKRLCCGHHCGGVMREKKCPPCLHTECRRAGQTETDTCVICYTDTLAEAPVIQLECGHIFHKRCIVQVLEGRWTGPNITFSFLNCPLCKSRIEHPTLTEVLKPIFRILSEVERKGLTRLQYEGFDDHPDLTVEGGPFYKNPVALALNKYAYYMCYECSQPYYGGENRCERQAEDDNVKLEELICGVCSNVGGVQSCDKHGEDHIEYKCRFCCSVAMFFCFGTTHFCNHCHNNHCRVVRLSNEKKLPVCPAGPNGEQLDKAGPCPLNLKHPPNGDEFAIGCGLCAHEASF